MNQLKIVLTQTLRQIVTGFLFTSGGILALSAFHRFLKIGLCP